MAQGCCRSRILANGPGCTFCGGSCFMAWLHRNSLKHFNVPFLDSRCRVEQQPLGAAKVLLVGIGFPWKTLVQNMRIRLKPRVVPHSSVEHHRVSAYRAVFHDTSYYEGYSYTIPGRVLPLIPALAVRAGRSSVPIACMEGTTARSAGGNARDCPGARSLRHQPESPRAEPCA